jgi:hypothetical protein
MRNLASVQKVLEVIPIENADRIELIKVLGWQCIVKKGIYKPGDLGIYIEIDSIVPDIPVFNFMKERKFRVKTIRLRGQISQGLFMSFDEMKLKNTKKLKEGTDLTNYLNIKKYEPEEEIIYKPKEKTLWWKLVYTIPFLKMFRKRVGQGASFPTHLVPKTDETRLQSFDSGFLEKYKDIDISVSIKMDGSSVTFILNKGKFSVASRNVWFIEKANNNFWKIVEETNIDKAMKKVFGKRNIVLQGELCGPGIQGNKYNFDTLRFFLFGAFDSDKKEYFTPKDLKDIYFLLKEYEANIDMCEIIDEYIKIEDVGLNINNWLELAESKSIFNEKTWNEGIVIRSSDNKPYGVKGMEGGRFSFKVVSNSFLLQYNL